MNLLDQWNEHIVRGNQLSRELEDFEGIIGAGQEETSEIAFVERGIGTTYISVLPAVKMLEFKNMVLNAINDARADKEKELKKLMGLWKPATINSEFEAAVQEMVNSNKPEPDPVEEKPPAVPEMTVEDVRRMYQDENMSMKDIAEYYSVSKSVINNFIYNNHLSRKKVKDDGFLDAKVSARQSKK